MSQPARPPDFSKSRPGPGPSAPAYEPNQPYPSYPQGPPMPYGGGAPMPYGAGPAGAGPLGQVRGTGVTMLLFIVTFGIWGLVWWYQVHEEMQRHRGGFGLGGGLALVIAVFASPVMAFVTDHEVQEMYESRGQRSPVRTTTGLWYIPGMFILVGPIVWFVKTNAALNNYWRQLGAS